MLLLALRGFREGFLVGAFSLTGILAGAYLGPRIASLLPPGSAPRMHGSLVVLIAVLGFAVLGAAVARAVGSRLRAGILHTPFEMPDSLGGAALGVAVGLAFVWIAGVFALQAPLPTGARASIERSEIVGVLDDRLPSDALLQAFARLDPLPEIEGPRPEVPEPDPALLDAPAVERVAPSVLQVVGVGQSVESAGSGWVAAPGLVVTNAHVVAGADCVSVRGGALGGRLPAEVALLDEHNDVAVLSVENLDLPALPLAEASSGEEVAILGYPGGGPFEARAGRAGATRTMLSSDLYGQARVERRMTSIRGVVQGGNSGGPVVNSGGEVVATIFAARIGPDDTAYGIPSPVLQAAIGEAEGATFPLVPTTEAASLLHKRDRAAVSTRGFCGNSHRLESRITHRKSRLSENSRKGRGEERRCSTLR